MGNSGTDQDVRTLSDILAEHGIETEDTYKLILWNDSVNSFEHVIICLVVVLKFTPEKAEQSAWTVHLQGKDVIKTGSKESLEPYKKILEEMHLTLTIEQ